MLLQHGPAAALTTDECVDVCIHTPAAAGHWECCSDPYDSSFQKPSCASGCLMAQYTASLSTCEAMCETASAPGCDVFQIPGGPEKGIAKCGTCNCGLRDCPWASPNPAKEPESCKDPANGGPVGGDCAWPQRCRGSLEGCKKGCVFAQEVNKLPVVFVAGTLVLLAVYVGGGVAHGVTVSDAALHASFRRFVRVRACVSPLLP